METGISLSINIVPNSMLYYYVGISLWVNYFVILRWRLLRSIAKDYSAKSWNWNSNQNFSDSKAYAISTILFLMESGREVSLKATAKFRCHWSLSLAASGEWRKKDGGERWYHKVKMIRIRQHTGCGNNEDGEIQV